MTFFSLSLFPGSGLYVAPVLDKGVTVVNVYLPRARWFNYWTGQEVLGAGTFVNLQV